MSVGMWVIQINASSYRNYLIEANADGYTDIFAEIAMTARDDFDPLAPQREAAFFYGLFLRGHSVEALRQDIDVPRSMLDKWMRAHDLDRKSTRLNSSHGSIS